VLGRGCRRWGRPGTGRDRDTGRWGIGGHLTGISGATGNGAGGGRLAAGARDEFADPPLFGQFQAQLRQQGGLGPVSPGRDDPERRRAACVPVAGGGEAIPGRQEEFGTVVGPGGVRGPRRAASVGGAPGGLESGWALGERGGLMPGDGEERNRMFGVSAGDQSRGYRPAPQRVLGFPVDTFKHVDVEFFRAFLHPMQSYRRWSRRRRLGVYAVDEDTPSRDN